MAALPSLIEWLHRLGHAVSGWGDVRDGTAITAELERMGADLPHGSGGSKVLEALTTFFHVTLESHSPLLDALPAELAVASDEELQAVLQLLLSAAVQSESRELYVESLLQMPDDVQTHLMGQVECVMRDVVSWEPPPATAAAEDVSSLADGSGPAATDRAGGLGLRALQHQVHAASAELEDLRRTNAALRAELAEQRRVSEAEAASEALQRGSGARSESSTGSGSGSRLAEAQLKDLRAELREREAAYAAASERFAAERRGYESTLKAQGDELDILRGKAAQSRRLELESARLKDRIAELTVQSEQTRLLEESNARYAARLNELETLAASIPKRVEVETQLRQRIAAAEAALAEVEAATIMKDAELARLQSERGAWLHERACLELAVKDAEARAEAAVDSHGARASAGTPTAADAANLEAENRNLRLQVEEFEQLLEDAQKGPRGPGAAAAPSASTRVRGRQVAELTVEVAELKRALREAQVQRDESVAHTALAEKEKAGIIAMFNEERHKLLRASEAMQERSAAAEADLQAELDRSRRRFELVRERAGAELERARDARAALEARAERAERALDGHRLQRGDEAALVASALHAVGKDLVRLQFQSHLRAAALAPAASSGGGGAGGRAASLAGLEASEQVLGAGRSWLAVRRQAASARLSLGGGGAPPQQSRPPPQSESGSVAGTPRP